MSADAFQNPGVRRELPLGLKDGFHRLFPEDAIISFLPDLPLCPKSFVKRMSVRIFLSALVNGTVFNFPAGREAPPDSQMMVNG